jgi:hypothetical protein
MTVAYQRRGGVAVKRVKAKNVQFVSLSGGASALLHLSSRAEPRTPAWEKPLLRGG